MHIAEGTVATTNTSKSTQKITYYLQVTCFSLWWETGYRLHI